jgi:hypothetical protein
VAKSEMLVIVDGKFRRKETVGKPGVGGWMFQGIGFHKMLRSS